MIELRSHTYGPASGGAPKQIVVLLHGLGANGADLISLAPLWAASLPDCLFVSPDAPFPCDMAPYGHQWFSLQDWSQESMLRGIEAVAPVVDKYLDNLLNTYNVPDSKLALMGFSQGCMTALYVAPRRKKLMAGVLGYSGRLLGAESLRGPDIHKVPTCLIHGDFDDVVTPDAWSTSMEALKTAQFPVEGQMLAGLGHSIDDRGVAIGLDFMKKVLL